MFMKNVKDIKNLFFEKKDTIFALVVSLIMHIFAFSFINTSLLQLAMNEEKNKLLEETKKDDYIFLVETPNVPEEENKEDTPFASDKALKSKGDINARPTKVFSDTSVFSFLGDGENSYIIKNNDNKIPSNKVDRLDDKGSSASKVETYTPSQRGIKGDTKIPASFDEGADRAVVFSSETGGIQLGTKAQEYFWYFYSLVNSIRDSWYLTIPNQAHFLGLLRTDEVEVLLSIDENGNIAFEKFLKQSSYGQNSLDSSCSKAVEYAEKLKPPPSGLLRDYGENGKIYIPFRFIYQNFSRD